MSSVSLEKWVAFISLVTRCLLGRTVETNETAFKNDPIAASFGRQRFQLGSERNLLISAQPFGLYTKPYPSRFALHSLSPGLFVHIHTSFLGLLSLSSFLHASRAPVLRRSRELLSRREAFYTSITISSLPFFRAFFPGPLSASHAHPFCSRLIHLKTTTTMTTTMTKLKPPRE